MCFPMDNKFYLYIINNDDSIFLVYTNNSIAKKLYKIYPAVLINPLGASINNQKNITKYIKPKKPDTLPSSINFHSKHFVVLNSILISFVKDQNNIYKLVPIQIIKYNGLIEYVQLINMKKTKP